MGLIGRWLINALALYLTSLLIPGITLRGAGPTLLAAAVFGIVNALLGTVLKVLTFPLSIVTLGLFVLVINALMLLVTTALVPGFEIRGFGSAFVGAIVLAIISFLLTRLVH